MGEVQKSKIKFFMVFLDTKAVILMMSFAYVKKKNYVALSGKMTLLLKKFEKFR